MTLIIGYIKITMNGTDIYNCYIFLNIPRTEGYPKIDEIMKDVRSTNNLNIMILGDQCKIKTLDAKQDRRKGYLHIVLDDHTESYRIKQRLNAHFHQRKERHHPSLGMDLQIYKKLQVVLVGITQLTQVLIRLR